MYLIGDVSREVNLSQKRIREYEKEGLITPAREPRTNNRLYSDFDILQIKQITQLIHKHGFTIACLKRLLASAPCWIIFDCKQKGDCTAFKTPHTPCYKIVKETPSDCARCPVYLNRDQKQIKFMEKEVPPEA